MMTKVLLKGLKSFILLVLLASSVNTQRVISATTTPRLTLNLETCRTLHYHAQRWERACHSVSLRQNNQLRNGCVPPVTSQKNDGTNSL